jgi:amino acid adenylation domain-containing protein
MFIRNGSPLPQFEITDWCNEAEKSERLHELLASEAGRKFDLEKDILFRFHCVKFSDNESFLCFTGHHIILDGWSLSVIAENISLFYNNYINNSNIPIPAPGLQFTDYVQWHEDILAGFEGKASLEYWQKEAGNAEFAVELPFDKRLCSKETIGFNKITLHLGPELSELVASFSKDQKVTRFNIMISVLYLLLSRYTGKREIIIGTNLAGRWDRKWIDQVGLFSNTIPLKCEIALADTFHSLLQKVVSKMEKAFLHQKIPFELLAHVNDAPALQKEQSICNVLYIDQDYNNAFDLKLPGIGCSLYESNEVNVNGFADLQFETIRNGSAISIELKYRRQVVPDLVAKALPLHFKNLLAEVVKDPLKCIPAYVYTEKNELHGVQQLSLFNKPADNDNVTVTGLFKKAAGIHAHSTAVICGERSLSYKELDRLSTQLCNYLLNNHRINDNRLIGIMMRRSERSIITILGILKAGCAFVPLDPEWPKDRKRIVLEDCRPSVLITDGENYTGSEQMADVATIIDYDAIDLADHFLPGNVVNGRDQRDGNAYVIYTSGTTGIPKGVLISNGALANYVKTCSAYFSISSTDRVLHQSSLGFDIAIEEIFPILCAGGVLVVSERRNSDVAYAVDLISDHLITIVSTTPSIINYYNQNAHRVKGLRLLISGGEELIPENIDRLMGQVPIYNTYGPTESTVCVTYNLVSAIEHTKVIGKPIDNTGVCILNEQLIPVPPGVIGEIFIGGSNLAKGYLNNPELTAEKFIPDPVAGKGLLYKTGDLAYWLPAGEIVFTGRKDSQVKILGYRIELSDIENCLMQHHCITCAKVIVKEAANKQKQLVAFYSCKENGSNNIDLRTWLLEKLPYQMVPHHFVQVDSFPLNSSGKINTASLAENYLHHEEHRNIPVNRVDRKLAELWKEVLLLPVIYASDNFFEAGGNSITGIALVAAVNRTFNTGYDIRHLFENPTLEAFAVLLDQRTAGRLPAPSLAPEAPLYDLSMAQHGLWLLHQFEKGLVAFNIFGVFQLTGPLELPALQHAFDAVIKRHSILRVSIITVDGSPKQIIDNEHSFTIKVADLRDRSDKESALKKAIAEESAREFDPGQCPLLRATVLLFDDNAAFLLFSMQHLISDGDSCLILAKEVFACYSYIIKNKTALQLPPLALQYKDFVFWQQQYLLSDKAVEDGLFWKHYLQGVASMCNLPFDSRPTTTRSYAGNTIDLTLPEADVDLLVKAHKQHAVSFYVLILSVTKLLLNKLTFHNDISLVSPWSGRLHPDFNPLIGLFVNPLIIRSEIDENDTIAGFIQATNRNFMAILRHKEYPFEKVVMALNENEGNNKGRFNVRLLWDESELPVNGFDNEIAITNELSLNQIRYYPEFSLHDLSFIFSKRQGIHVALQYNSDLFHKSTIELVMLRLLKLISTVVSNPNLTIREIDLRLPFEIERDNKINALFTKSELF